MKGSENLGHPNIRERLALLIPAYNAAQHLPRLLKSAARQAEPFDEIWVFDDCSSDDTASVARANGAEVIRGLVNKGCSHAKNVLAARTSVEWVHFHDADDELCPNFTSLAHRRMEDGRSDVVLFPYEERDDATGEHIRFRLFDPVRAARDARAYAIDEQINPFCGLYRREAFLRAGGYDEDPFVHHNEDVAMHLRLAFDGQSFAVETEISIINHRRADSMSAANRLKCLQSQYYVMAKTAAQTSAEPYAAKISARLSRVAAGLAAELDWKTADKAMTLARRLAEDQAFGNGGLFKLLCRMSPQGALRVRESLIRLLKPSLRKGYPGWKTPVWTS